MKNQNVKMVLSLTLIAAISAFLLNMVVMITKPRIEKNKAEYLQQAILEILPESKRIVAYGKEKDRFIIVGQDDPKPFFHAVFDAQGNLIAVLLQAQGQGYQELVKILFAYDPTSEQLLGIKVLESKETPGLGDRILTDKVFLKSFQKLAMPLEITGEVLIHSLELTRRGKPKEAWQIDGITGATISSRAVVRILTQGGNRFFPLLKRYPLPLDKDLSINN